MYGFVKRIFDIVISVVGLVILSPILIITAVAIKIESAGNIIFKQVRLGKNAKEFNILKFRSMRADSEFEGSGQYSFEGDPRVTCVGKFIRRFSIFDETYYASWYNIQNFGKIGISDPRAQAVILNSGANAIRFISVVDADYKDYVEAGFVITDKYATPTIEGGFQYSVQTKLYTKLFVRKDGTEDIFMDVDKMGESEFSLVGAGILYTNLPVDITKNKNKTYYATPYVKLEDGTYLCGNTLATSYNELLN